MSLNQNISKNKRSTRREQKSSLTRYLDEISKTPVLPRAEEIVLIERAQKGCQQAAEKLIRSNLLFVVSVAKEYQNCGLSLADLISEGNIGLMRALETFDPNRSLKFITYAVWWIRQAMRQALYDKSRIVRLPQNRLQQVRQTLRAVDSLEQKFKREPTFAEISEALGNESHAFCNASKYLQFQQYLDTPLDHDSTKRLINIIPDTNTSSPDAGLKSESLKKELKIALKVLKNRERVILQLLYGLGGSRPLTLGEVGEPLGLCRERVRQIRNEALARLRRSKQVRNNLRGYLE